MPKRKIIDVRGLATHEQREGELVELGRRTYRVEKIVKGKATLKWVAKEKTDGEFVGNDSERKV